MEAAVVRQPGDRVGGGLPGQLRPGGGAADRDLDHLGEAREPVQGPLIDGVRLAGGERYRPPGLAPHPDRRRRARAQAGFVEPRRGPDAGLVVAGDRRLTGPGDGAGRGLVLGAELDRRADRLDRRVERQHPGASRAVEADDGGLLEVEDVVHALGDQLDDLLDRGVARDHRRDPAQRPADGVGTALGGDIDADDGAGEDLAALVADGAGGEAEDATARRLVPGDRLAGEGGAVSRYQLIGLGWPVSLPHRPPLHLGLLIAEPRERLALGDPVAEIAVEEQDEPARNAADEGPVLLAAATQLDLRFGPLGDVGGEDEEALDLAADDVGDVGGLGMADVITGVGEGPVEELLLAGERPLHVLEV